MGCVFLKKCKKWAKDMGPGFEKGRKEGIKLSPFEDITLKTQPSKRHQPASSHFSNSEQYSVYQYCFLLYTTHDPLSPVICAPTIDG